MLESLIILLATACTNVACDRAFAKAAQKSIAIERVIVKRVREGVKEAAPHLKKIQSIIKRKGDQLTLDLLELD